LQPVDQLSVREPVLARGGVDADDPQPAEIALLAAAADERVFQRGVDRLFRGAIQLALVGVVALGQTKQLFPLRSTDRSSFYPRHLVLLKVRLKPDTTDDGDPIPRSANPQSLFVRQHPRQLGRVDVSNCRRSAQPALAFARLAAQDVLLERAAAEKLAVLRPLEPLRGPAVRLDLQLFR